MHTPRSQVLVLRDLNRPRHRTIWPHAVRSLTRTFPFIIAALSLSACDRSAPPVHSAGKTQNSSLHTEQEIGNPTSPPSPAPQPARTVSLDREAREFVEQWKRDMWHEKDGLFHAVLCVSKKIERFVSTGSRESYPGGPMLEDLGTRREEIVTTRYDIEATDLRLVITEDFLSEADALNGFQWKGSFQHFAKASRYKGGPWVSGLWNPDMENYSLNPVYEIAKHNGKWTIYLSAISQGPFGKSMRYDKSDILND